MINLIYERNGVTYDYVNCKSAHFLNKWIEVLKKHGPITIVKIWSN